MLALPGLLAEIDIAAEHHDPRFGDQHRSCIDSSLAQQELGWKPEMAINDGLEVTAKWFKEKASRA